MFDEYTLFFVPQKVGISYKAKKANAAAYFSSMKAFLRCHCPPGALPMKNMQRYLPE